MKTSGFLSLLLGVDHQLKNRPSFNDDAVNGRFHITWSIEF